MFCNSWSILTVSVFRKGSKANLLWLKHFSLNCSAESIESSLR